MGGSTDLLQGRDVIDLRFVRDLWAHMWRARIVFLCVEKHCCGQTQACSNKAEKEHVQMLSRLKDISMGQLQCTQDNISLWIKKYPRVTQGLRGPSPLHNKSYEVRGSDDAIKDC